MHKVSRTRTLFIFLLTFIFAFSMFSTPVFAAGGSAGNSAPIITGVSTTTAGLTVGYDATKFTATVDLVATPSVVLRFTATDSNTKDTLTWTANTSAMLGTLSTSTISGRSVNITYTAPVGSPYTTSFTIQVKDNRGAPSQVVTVNLSGSPPITVNQPPVNKTLPSITGTVMVGNPLTANPGTWSDENPTALTYKYSWLMSVNQDMSSSTEVSAAATYTPSIGDVGKYLALEVIATDGSTPQLPSKPARSVPVQIQAQPAQRPVINYLSLGDSIATGTLYGSTKITAYPYYFNSLLISRNPNADVFWKNLSKDGDATEDLLLKVTTDQTMISEITKANIITISIGGNNLMRAAKDSSDIYNFNVIDEAKAEIGRAAFVSNWPDIISAIKAKNSTAKIIINTVYNPYNQNSDATRHAIVDKYLFTQAGKTGINSLINDSVSLGYSVANVYEVFNRYSEADKSIQVTYLYWNNFWEQLTRNPHPRALGQEIIKQLNYQAYDPSYVYTDNYNPK